MLTKLINFWIYAEHLRDSRQYGQQKLIVSLTLAALTAATLLHLVILLGNTLPTGKLSDSHWLVVLSQILFCVSLISTKLGRVKPAAHALLLGVVCIPVITDFYWPFGFTLSVPVMLTAVLIAHLLLGIQAGRGYGIVFCCLVILDLFYQNLGLPQSSIPLSNMWASILVVGQSLVLTVVILLFLTQFSQNQSTLYSELVGERDQFAHRALHDPLTELYNREEFESQLNQFVIMPNHEFAYLFIDLDNFKQLNDKYGHQGGDEFLKVFARRLLKFTHADDVVARFGGDEFTVLLKNTSKGNVLTAKMDNLVSNLKMPIWLQNESIIPGFSIGVACWPNEKNNNAALFDCADDAMYQAKQAHIPWLLSQN